MSPEKLIYMANQIATAFANLPEAEAAGNVASHINDFWAPAMRARLLGIIASGGAGLSPVVMRAGAQIRRAAPA
ncbi:MULTISPECIES: formate dehydrogenase subunit delta [Actibacterium]|uniref:Formate dehydrogenase subunit delta n=1 Tax=Actibacterium naphthalenivorans TaxID=1614693 RepID=A0A840CAU6_9RHOB|nr:MULTISPECIES: formate dehydrogenase subunit delta [Actibacterium]ALG90637.1 formate dehydrogenase [Actibacterium sp. EMB200-NS6]MBB4023184.1 formate dehydrogenase subunit delta [Actibacterium naphthalenivorans]